ncbi:SDR family oxidoreductase [Aeromicrobium sp.]|uniref:SDR family oxidoreductase n=1 Tax=Aeromicrobium sp. TaxID=1871063 RepID=UPI0019CAC211|nr:SDR family oxidoreductase [Aeromicrobium sp.]MBC7633879.1 SDR family oxidoreductase [Aeromicrobium sp.]
MNPIALTGSTGAVGGIAAHLLADAGIAVRLLVRDASRAPNLQGSEVHEAPYGDNDACAAALSGVDTVFMVSAAEDENRVQQHCDFIDSAVRAGVRQVVYLSFVEASAESGFLLGRDHGATENHLRASGLEWTLLRDNFYAEVLPMFAADGVIRGPAGEGRVAAVSQRDVGAVVAQVLRNPREHSGRKYDLTGPDALTLSEVASVLTEITGRTYSFVDETLEEARASRAHLGAPDWLVAAWISTYTAIRDGELEHVSGDITRLLGRPATSFDEAIAERA